MRPKMRLQLSTWVGPSANLSTILTTSNRQTSWVIRFRRWKWTKPKYRWKLESPVLMAACQGKRRTSSSASKGCRCLKSAIISSEWKNSNRASWLQACKSIISSISGSRSLTESSKTSTSDRLSPTRRLSISNHVSLTHRRTRVSTENGNFGRSSSNNTSLSKESIDSRIISIHSGKTSSEWKTSAPLRRKDMMREWLRRKMRTYLIRAAVNCCSWMVKATYTTPRAGSSTRCSYPRERHTPGPTFAGRSSTRLGSF